MTTHVSNDRPQCYSGTSQCQRPGETFGFNLHSRQNFQKDFKTDQNLRQRETHHQDLCEILVIALLVAVAVRHHLLHAVVKLLNALKVRDLVGQIEDLIAQCKHSDRALNNGESLQKGSFNATNGHIWRGF